MDLYWFLRKLVISNLNKSNIYEYYTHYILCSNIDSDSTLIDLGANEGRFYSLLNGKYNCMCYAVEASPYLFTELPKNPKIKAFNYAIGKENGLVTFFLSNYFEAHSLDPVISNLWGTSESLKVQGITFENFVSQENITTTDILKIDIEGAELDVLGEMTPRTFSLITQITVEFHDFLNKSIEYNRRMKEVIKKLKQNGFLVIKTSDADWREVLCLNRKLVHVNYNQQIRLRIIIPFLLTCMSLYRNAGYIKSFLFRKKI